MEDPESEWAIQEYPSWKEEDEATSMVKWILNKGYGIGKKMVITGIIVSSAPLVLPPLVVFSAMGVAFSVPFGLVFAGYACTNKLMSTLLPTPELSPLLLDDEVKKEEQLEDIKQGVEYLDDYRQIRGGLVTNMGGIADKKDEEDDLHRENLMEDEGFVLDDDEYGENVEALMTNVDENVEDDEQMKHAVELDDDDGDSYRPFLQRKNIVIEEEEREQMEDIQQGVEMRLGLNMAGDERIRGSGNFGGGVDEQGYEEDVGEYLEGDDGDSLEEERKEAMENDETEEIVKGSTGLLEKIRDEGRNIDNDSTTGPVTVKEIEISRNMVEKGSKNEEPVGEIRQVVVLAGGNEELLEEKDLVARQVVADTIFKNINMGSQEKNSYNSENVTEDAILRTKKEQLIHANADASEIGDESGLDLFDELNISMNLESLEAGDKTNESTANDNVDVLALPSFRRPRLDSNSTIIASTIDTKEPSRKDNLDEEKIWEKIVAMRSIVGYKAPSEATYIGELKALYVFTGVEPPASFKGDSNLDEVKANLKFLMSIVGVK